MILILHRNVINNTTGNSCDQSVDSSLLVSRNVSLNEFMSSEYQTSLSKLVEILKVMYDIRRIPECCVKGDSPCRTIAD